MRKKRRRILVIDHLRERRSSVRMVLEVSGFDVRIALTGRRALDLLDTERFEIMLVNVSGPQVDGTSVIKSALRKHPRLRAFAIVDEGPRLSVETASTLAEVWGAERVFANRFDAIELLAAIGSATKAA